MARTRHPRRLSELAAVAVDHFIRAGYAGTQVEDVARSLGVAKGTIYLYVESKEALFDLAVRFAAGDDVDTLGHPLPLRSARSETVSRIETELAKRARPALLLDALGKPDARDVSAEAHAILGEIYDLIHANRVGLKLLDRCAREMPDLTALWYHRGREGVRLALEAWLTIRRSQLAAPDPGMASFFIMEALAFWAMHRHWDPAPPVLREEDARRLVVSFLVRGITLHG